MLFVRLFIMMGVSWAFEGISFLISPENDNRLFTIFDIWNALQGPIIFLSFIMKRRVLLLITKRFSKNGGVSPTYVFISIIFANCVSNEYDNVLF